MPRNPDEFATVIDQFFASRAPAMHSRFLTDDLDALQAWTQDREFNADVRGP
jgi:hypothetical protein